jgi:Colicin E5 ribonuclease domain
MHRARKVFTPLSGPPAIGLGIKAVIAARAASAAEAAVDLSNLSPKIIKDMTRLGWTKQGIMDTIQQAEEGGTTFTVPNRYTGRTATEYMSPSTGKFIVVDDATKGVIQVSGRGYLPNHLTK